MSMILSSMGSLKKKDIVLYSLLLLVLVNIVYLFFYKLLSLPGLSWLAFCVRFASRRSKKERNFHHLHVFV